MSWMLCDILRRRNDRNNLIMGRRFPIQMSLRDSQAGPLENKEVYNINIQHQKIVEIIVRKIAVPQLQVSCSKDTPETVCEHKNIEWTGSRR